MPGSRSGIVGSREEQKKWLNRLSARTFEGSRSCQKGYAVRRLSISRFALLARRVDILCSVRRRGRVVVRWWRGALGLDVLVVDRHRLVDLLAEECGVARAIIR